MGEPRFYDIKDAARYLGVAPSTLRYWESRGLISAGRNAANDYRRYTVHDLIHASEIAFYRKLGVPAKELESYRTLSAKGLDAALALTEANIEQRIAELEAMRARLAQQRALNAAAEQLRHSGMRPARPAIARLSAIDYDALEPWKVLVEEPWRYGVFIDARNPALVHEAVADARPGKETVLWQRIEAEHNTGCLECLLKVAPSMDASNVDELLDRARASGVEPENVAGTYLLTATDDEGRWDFYRAWIGGMCTQPTASC